MNDNTSTNNNKKRLKLYYGLLVTVLCIIGVSFAWFRLYLSQSENNTLSSRTCFNTTLTEDTSKIELTDAFPVIDSEGLKQTPFTFTIKNNCDSYVQVYITIDSAYRTSTDTSYLKDNYIKVNVSPKDTTSNASVILGEQSLTDLDNNSKGYVLVTTGLKANEEKSYDLRIWMDSAVTTEQGLNKSWAGKIVVVSNAKKEPTNFAETILANNIINEPLTILGEDISTESEALLASTEDDYGTSYYFRGAVTNNYVEFANKCWRVVRIGGDNTVKLILHNDNTASADNPCSAVANEETAAFARYNDDIYTSEFNTAYDDNAFVGFMYGDAGCVGASGIDNDESNCMEAGYEWKNSTSHNSAHTNKNYSTILTNLKKWYSYYLKSYDSLITDNVFCADKNNVTDTTYNPFNWRNVIGLGYGINKTYYGTTQRLVSSSGNAGGTGPSLKCNSDLSKITSKIGLITADELVFAGYAAEVEGSHSYLQENASNDWWWSLSPAGFDGGAGVWGVYGGDGVLGSDGVSGGGGLRPYISLGSSTNVTGDGTSGNPYKIVS